MVRVLNGKVVEEYLPPAGILKDGRTVSNYDLLPMEELQAEGWLPLEVIIPDFNKETQYIVHDRYEILSIKVIEYFKVEQILIKEGLIQ